MYASVVFAAQVVVAIAAILTVTHRVHTLFAKRIYYPAAGLLVVGEQHQRHNWEQLSKLAKSSSFLGVFASALVESKEEHMDLGIAMDFARREVVSSFISTARFIRGVSSLGTLSALSGVVAHYLWLTRGDHGILGLVRGLPEEVMIWRASLSVILGLSVVVLCLFLRRETLREGRRWRDVLAKVADQVEREADAPPR